MLVSNAVIREGESVGQERIQETVDREIQTLWAAVRGSDVPWLVVSNEVGLGIVPANELARTYRDTLGRVNQRLAAKADEVLFMVAGLPWRIK
jgi:adenosylcobinamide kinase/adenosylcobinamide-phosphate guanylyltransferase